MNEMKHISDYFPTVYEVESEYHKMAMDYLAQRGISMETAQKYNLEYTMDNGIVGILFRTGENSSVTRFVNEQDPKKRYQKSGVSDFFNFSVFRENNDPVFVTEGEFDCLSILETGYSNAVCLGGVTNADKFMERLKATKKRNTLILVLDNDDAGEEAARTIRQKAKELGIACLTPTLGNVKDVNELLCKDANKFANKVQTWLEQAKQLGKVLTQEEEEKLKKFDENLMSVRDIAIDQSIRSISSLPVIETGFPMLDQTINGVRASITILGATPSLGKTTFFLQIATYIAAHGQDVFFFSYEMTDQELHAKNITRTYHGIKTKGTKLVTSEIIRGDIFKNPDKVKVYNQSRKLLEEPNRHMRFYDGNSQMNILKIKSEVDEYIKITGRIPVVFIDYLQMIPPENENYSDKQNIDRIMLVLRQMKNEGVACFVISSLSRASYDSPTTMGSFKESGNIEFAADVAMALDYEAMYTSPKKNGKVEIDMNNEKSKETRKVVLTILKNRIGQAGKQISYDFIPAANLFAETGVFVSPT